MRWAESCWSVEGESAGTPVYFGAVRPEEQRPMEPQAFLVRLPAGHAGLRTHFHPIDQFQFFVAGSGRFGRHPARFGLLHYSDALTPYGPLLPGPDGVAFMTIRHEADFGINNMPDEAEQLGTLLAAAPRAARDRRNVTVDLLAHGQDEGWDARTAHHDGLRIATRRFVAGEPLSHVDATGPGAFLLLVAGALSCDDGGHHVLSAGALAWLPPDRSEHGDQQSRLVADDGGALIALLQFPTVPAGRASSKPIEIGDPR